MKQAAALHLEVVVARDELPLELEHHNRDGALRRLQGRFVGVDVRGKRRQRPQADAVAALKHIGILVAQGIAHDRRDAGLAAERRAHPEHIVVAPLDIYIVEVHELVHDNVRARSTVKDVTDNVKAVHCQVLDQVAECHDELVTHLDVDDGVDDFIIINFLVVIVVVHMKELVDDICECRGHFFSHFRSCKF